LISSLANAAYFGGICPDIMKDLSTYQLA